jgi:serine/threonine protein kinase
LTHFYNIGNLIDTYALGHYARVFDAVDVRTGQEVALKVMRAEHITPDGQPRWEAEAFLHEADLLLDLADVPAVMNLYDCGYLESKAAHPSEGNIKSFGLNIDAFRAEFFPSLRDQWRPYLSLERLPRQDNLLYVMKSDEQRRRLPTEEALDLALQFAQLLYRVHKKNIVYLDHKLEHLFWDGRQLRLIDLNSSKRVGGIGQPAEQQIINDLHNLCVGILYPVLTGQSPQKGSLRPQPGSQAEVDRRYEEIQHLDFSTAPELSPALVELLEAGAKKQIPTATALLAELQRIAVRFGWSFAGQSSSPALAQAREHMRHGLEKLRESQEAAHHAREYLLEAAILDGINEDMEDELRRLMGQISQFLNHRPIP